MSEPMADQRGEILDGKFAVADSRGGFWRKKISAEKKFRQLEVKV
jgi:hypothetical protein